jgi:hypothetical protein
MGTYEDPGWRRIVRYLPLLLLPLPLMPSVLIRRPAGDGITRIRALYLRAVTFLFLFLVPLFVINSQDRSDPSPSFVVLGRGRCSGAGRCRHAGVASAPAPP